jgi:hypothetical protein
MFLESVGSVKSSVVGAVGFTLVDLSAILAVCVRYGVDARYAETVSSPRRAESYTTPRAALDVDREHSCCAQHTVRRAEVQPRGTVS